MSLFLVRAKHGLLNQRNAGQVNAYIVDAADADAAVDAAYAAAPNGESKPKRATNLETATGTDHPSSWEAIALTNQTLIVQGLVTIPANGEKLRGS